MCVCCQTVLGSDGECVTVCVCVYEHLALSHYIIVDRSKLNLLNVIMSLIS